MRRERNCCRRENSISPRPSTSADRQKRPRATQSDDDPWPEEVQAINKHDRQRARSMSRRRRGQSRAPKSSERQRAPGVDKRDAAERRCRYCDRMHEPSKRVCPAYNQSCTRCGKRNHFAVVCKSSVKLTTDICQLKAEESLLSLENPDCRRTYTQMSTSTDAR